MLESNLSVLSALVNGAEREASRRFFVQHIVRMCLCDLSTRRTTFSIH